MCTYLCMHMCIMHSFQTHVTKVLSASDNLYTHFFLYVGKYKCFGIVMYILQYSNELSKFRGCIQQYTYLSNFFNGGVYNFLSPAQRPKWYFCFIQHFLLAAKEGNLAQVKLEVEAGTHIDTCDRDGYTALIWVSGYI